MLFVVAIFDDIRLASQVHHQPNTSKHRSPHQEMAAAALSAALFSFWRWLEIMTSQLLGAKLLRSTWYLHGVPSRLVDQTAMSRMSWYMMLSWCSCPACMFQELIGSPCHVKSLHVSPVEVYRRTEPPWSEMTIQLDIKRCGFDDWLKEMSAKKSLAPI